MVRRHKDLEQKGGTLRSWQRYSCCNVGAGDDSSTNCINSLWDSTPFFLPVWIAKRWSNGVMIWWHSGQIKHRNLIVHWIQLPSYPFSAVSSSIPCRTHSKRLFSILTLPLFNNNRRKIVQKALFSELLINIQNVSDWSPGQMFWQVG